MTVYKNNKAYHDYTIVEQHEAGMVLTGVMIKAIRAGKLNISEAFCRVVDGEMFLYNVIFDGQTYNDIKLLLKKKEIEQLGFDAQVKNMTIVPLSISVAQYAKIAVGLARGKKNYDKRQSIKEKDLRRERERDQR